MATATPATKQSKPRYEDKYSQDLSSDTESTFEYESESEPETKPQAKTQVAPWRQREQQGRRQPAQDPNATALQPYQKGTPKAGPLTYRGGAGREVGKEGQTGIQAKNEEKEDTGLKLRLDLNLDIEVELKASIHGDLTLALLSAPCLNCETCV
ncbi:hypothetical protein BDV38DRAFT_281905 [Aspergillus pseudotamarii]|uniref:Uncharacterized protein n=2 Tax=Aspergillus subgen. Circumdati TaxID=2720871 RepID=A0A5N6SXT2_ASPPS|nr:uncharacterized protein BDV38DRAFT_281905 [Aspergillus pseudotamarii]KAE8138601.1 hypothetical protein BDV38DRAFT_281905 [Aspergillus pseudotamarii]